jgi:hypothetical protein
VCAAAAACNHNVGTSDLLCVALRYQLMRSPNVTDDTGCIGSASRNYVGFASLGAALFGDGRHGTGSIGAPRLDLDFRSEQLIKKHIAARAIGVIASRNGVDQDQDAFQTAARGRRCGLARVVRLQASSGDEDVSLLSDRLTDKILERTSLVPAQTETGAVVTLDPDLGPAEHPREARQRFEGRWQESEANVVNLLE